MKTRIIEATNGEQNWGKFLLGRFDEEWDYISPVADYHLLINRGMRKGDLMVMDLQTKEAAIFRPDPSASAKQDLDAHQIWVCPLFEPFLVWLYSQDLSDLSKLPPVVDLPDALFAFRGYRRTGG